MDTRIVLLESHLAALREQLFDLPGVEGAAFLLCGESRSDRAIKLISRRVIPIRSEEYLRREAFGLSISSAALTRVSKLARAEGLSVLFAHSHPQGVAEFSNQDDHEEENLLPFLQARIRGRVHGTLVLTEEDIRGRLYAPTQIPVETILSVGQRIHSWSAHTSDVCDAFFDRQVRAFGKDIQRVLSGLHIGIVGLGGTGSPVAEQLCRLGVGRISLFDGDRLEVTNVNRVYGSRTTDAGELKVHIAKQHLDDIGLGALIEAFPQHITEVGAAKALRDCDVVFGCTDKELPRAILIQLSLSYSIPVFDLGVLIDSHDGKILGVHGRVTTLMAGEACLFCRGRISSEAIRIESLSDADRKNQIREGYAPELQEPAPAVIAFTSMTASVAVSELLQRLTGFMGRQRQSSEVLLAMDQSRIRTNRIAPKEGCICGDLSVWGRGDIEPYLDMIWATHTT